MPASVSGTIDHIIFHNAENAYTVMVLIPVPDGWPADEDIDDYLGDGLSVVGNFPGISAGESVRLSGDFVDHSAYGRQFKAVSYEIIEPHDAESMKRYLGSGAVKGIGPKLAARIVEKFKEDTFRIMEEEPERLAEIKGISMRMAMDLADAMIDKKEQRAVMMFLSSIHISGTVALRIYQRYGTAAKEMIGENPYRLADEIDGIGFKMADELAMRIGFEADSEFRMRSGIIYVLEQMAANGHTYLPKDVLLSHAAELLGGTPDALEQELMQLVIEKKIVLRADEVYARRYYRAESRCAGFLLALAESFSYDEKTVEAAIRETEEEAKSELDARQKEAVHAAAKNGVFILTGGPGTGKTTTINTLIRYFEREGLNIFLAAPTGRAAKRMSEATNRPARTIHRLLEVNGAAKTDGEPSGYFARNEDNPLECDVVILDEVSMVDILLFHSLLCAIPEGVRLILVGDENQLPSVGPGNVLKDLIRSGLFPVVTLETIFRQAGESDIILNAHAINRGRHVKLDNKSKDFFISRKYSADEIVARTVSYLKGNMAEYVGAPVHELQVLTPTRKGVLGVGRLNDVLQEALNPKSPKKAEHSFGERLFREGDKVMQTKNNYQMEWEVLGKHAFVIDSGTGVFNGDVGFIRQISEYERLVTVEFDDGRRAKYGFAECEQLELAYAMTIHKSQGSEYPAVILPLFNGPSMLLNRNLLYTAVTRAKKCVLLIGDEKIFYKMIDNVSENRRYSGLVERLNERLP